MQNLVMFSSNFLIQVTISSFLCSLENEQIQYFAMSLLDYLLPHFGKQLMQIFTLEQQRNLLISWQTNVLRDSWTLLKKGNTIVQLLQQQ